MLANKRVLTVDDSSTVRTFLRYVLTRQGVTQVDEAASGEEALAKWLGGQKYDLILLDLFLPDMDGIQVLKQIRERDDESAVVVITGMGGIKSATAAVRMGADGYIEKQDLSVNGDLSEFFYALEQALEHRAGLVAQKQLAQIKADFYSMITHDLRNPTGAVLLSLQLLLDGEGGELSPGQAELVNIARDATERLHRLINDYLDFAKIDAGFLRLDLAEAELNSLVESSVHLAGLQAQAREQTLSLDLPPEPVYAVVDRERLKQVLENLISNAIKYTPKGGKIVVQLRIEDDHAVFRVSDNGMGIPRDQLPALFSKYHRVPGTATRGIRGTGLGLLIVKEVVEAHGGSVSAESEGVPGKGSTFTVRIPLGQGR